MPKLIYKIDKKHDAEILRYIVEDAKNYKGLSKILRLDKEQIKKILKSNKQKQNKIISSVVDNRYRVLDKYLNNSVKSYQKSWNKINDEFFSLVKRITKHDWKFKKYYCIVSAFHGGISSWGENKIVRIWSENPYTQRRTTAHELVLSHIWTILEKNERSKNWPDNKKWEYAEVISWCLLGLEDSFSKFWPWLSKEERFPKKHNYPQLLPLQKKLYKVYINSKDFNNFLKSI